MGLSRNEDILQSIVDGTQYTDPPKSRVEDLLLQVKEVIEEGGGGTSDYDDLENKPQIGGVTLSGNKSAADLSLASLDVNGKVPAAQLPSYVDDIINGYLHDGKFYEDDQYTTEITAEDGKIYVDLATNKTYRWSGLAYVEVSESLALGETSSTAYAGDKGKANADAITAIKDGTTIDSFGDVETALSGKQDTLTFDDVPTDNSNNPVKSNGVYDALALKADASIVKKEFIGTTDEWNALTTAQKKEYDTYQITDDYAEGGGPAKELRYTGTGTMPNTIDFGNDTPKRIMCIIPDPDEEFVLSNYEAIGEISWGMMLALSYWSTQSGGVPTTGNGGTNLIRMSFSGNTVTLNAGNAAQIANYSGQKYLVKYEV